MPKYIAKVGINLPAADGSDEELRFEAGDEVTAEVPQWMIDDGTVVDTEAVDSIVDELESADEHDEPLREAADEPTFGDHRIEVVDAESNPAPETPEE